MGWRLRRIATLLRQGGVIAYPTEAVWGLGCDPWNGAAVARILELKGRAQAKGVILIAADWGQLAPFIQPLSMAQQAKLATPSPGPVTWVVPARAEVPRWLTGEHGSIAVRVSTHGPVQALCRAYGGALVSTSANPSGHAPARSALRVRQYFGDALDALYCAPLGGAKRPSQIRRLEDERLLRA